MKKNILVTVFIFIWCNAFANHTFSQSFFDDYNYSTEGNFSYKNQSYRDDAKKQEYNHAFNKDDSSSYNCSFDASGQVRCGDYKIINYKNNAASTQIKAHFKKIKDVKDVRDVTAGDDFNCALDDADDVYCWGSNKMGQLGSETEKTKISKPLKVDIDKSINFKKIYTKAHYACALDENGGAYCWGDGSNGEVGNGEKGHFTKPQKVKTDVQFSRLSMARTYTCGVAKDSRDVYCWGKSKKGTASLDSEVPVKM